MESAMERILDYSRRVRGAFDSLRHPAPADGVLKGDVENSYTIEPLGLSHDLIMFRLLVGIYQDKSFRAPHGFDPHRRPVVTTNDRPAPNMGIYTIVYDNEIKAKKSFSRFSVLINVCLGLQLVVAAALTAIGAAGGSNRAVTVFGAINTIIAGFLTFLKGSGLPNRYKYYQHEWGKVREYIEHRERDLALGRADIDVHAEIAKIRQMFDEVRQDVETNTPERFIGSNQTSRQREPAAGGSYPQAHFGSVEEGGTQGSSMEQKIMGAVNGLRSSGQTWLHNKEQDASNANNTVHTAGQRFTQGMLDLKSQVQSKMHDLESAEQRMHQEKQAALQDKTSELSRIANEKIRDVADAEHDTQTHTVDTIRSIEDDARTEARNWMERTLDTEEKHEPDTTPHPS